MSRRARCTDYRLGSLVVALWIAGSCGFAAALDCTDADGAVEVNGVIGGATHGAVTSHVEIEWSRRAWRLLLERRVAAQSGKCWSGVLTGPGRGVLRSWCVGRFRLRTALGTGGLSSLGAGNAILRVSPQLGGNLLGAAVLLRHGAWRSHCALATPWTSAASARTLVRLPAVSSLSLGRETIPLSWLFVVSARRARGTQPRISTIYTLALRWRAADRDLRVESTFEPGRGREVRMTTHATTHLGAVDLRLRLRDGDAPDLMRDASAAPAQAVVRSERRAEVEIRSHVHGATARIAAQGSVRGAPFAGGADSEAFDGKLRARITRQLHTHGTRIQADVGWSRAGWIAGGRLFGATGSIGWARAGQGGVAWTGRLRCRVGRPAALGLEVEVRGWRGTGSREAAGQLGAGLGIDGASLAPATDGGAIAACRLDLQRAAVRVRLAVGTRETRGGAVRGLITCRVSCYLD